MGRSNEVGTPELIDQIKNFLDKDRRVSISAQFNVSVGTVHSIIREELKTVRQPPYSPDLAPFDFCLFPKLKEKLRGCRYETIEEMKEAVTKVIDVLTQEDFHEAFQKLLERCNNCIAAGGDFFEGG